MPSAKLGLIRLDSVAHLERGFGPSRIDRFNRQFTVGIYGNVAPGHSLGEAAADTQKLIVESIGLAAGLLRCGSPARSRSSKRPRPT